MARFSTISDAAEDQLNRDHGVAGWFHFDMPQMKPEHWTATVNWIGEENLIPCQIRMRGKNLSVSALVSPLGVERIKKGMKR